jgi:hypothetical protein
VSARKTIPGQPPTSEVFPVNPPTFTALECRCLAWMVASIAWIPDSWAPEIGSIAKKLRAFLGDAALDENPKRSRLLADDEVTP